MKEYNPDLLGQLMEMRKVVKCVVDKLSVVEGLEDAGDNQPLYIKEEACFDFLTKDLRKSKYQYAMNILEKDFSSIKPVSGVDIIFPF